MIQELLKYDYFFHLPYFIHLIQTLSQILQWIISHIIYLFKLIIYFHLNETMIIIPQYNRFGSEEDSLVKYLREINQSPKKNITENLDNQKSTLGTDRKRW